MYNNTAGNDQVSVDSYKKYFLPTVKIDNSNIEIDGGNFYDQPVNDSIKQYDEVRKISTGQGDDYATGCFLDYSYFGKNYRLIAADLSKQKALDFRHRFKSNSTNYFYWYNKSNSCKYKSNNLLCTRKVKRNNIRIFKRNNKSFLSQLKILLLVKKN